MDGASDQAEDRVVEVKLQAVVGFAGDAQRDELQSFIDEMPDRYFLANPVDVVRRHARIARDRDEDDYSRIIEMAKAFGLRGEALEPAVNQIIYVYQWMSTFAIMSLYRAP